MPGLRYSEAPAGSAKHHLMEKSCQPLLKPTSKALCSISLAGAAQWGDLSQGVPSLCGPGEPGCHETGCMEAVEMFCFKKTFFFHQPPRPFKASQAAEWQWTGLTKKDALGPGALRKKQYLCYSSPSGSYGRSNLVVTPQELLVIAEIVKVMLVLSLNVHLLPAWDTAR